MLIFKATVIHYLILEGWWTLGSAIFLEIIRFFCYYSICFYYCKKATAYLPWGSKFRFGLLVLFVFLVLWEVLSITTLVASADYNSL